MTTPELPPLELHCESGRAHAAFTMESVEARERILLARIAELSRALVDCVDWMESGRASTDWGFDYIRAKAIIAARKA